MTTASKPTLVLCHLGTPLPPHVKTCIEQIRAFSDIRIRVIADGYIPLMGDMSIASPRCFEDHPAVRAMQALPFKENEPNPLWRTAAMRFAYIAALADEYNLDEIIHFDNDVLIYKDPIDLLPELAKGNDISITECNEDLLIAGFVYIRDCYTAVWLAEALTEMMSTVDDNEMRLLRLIADARPELFSFLPLMPSLNRTHNFDGVFDCASWGQFVGGTHQEPGVPWAGDNHFIGRALKANIFTITWDEDREGRCIPLCVDGGGLRYPIFNLHIHSKELDKYASK